MEIRRVPIKQVEPWEKNPRAITRKDFDRLKRQIQKLGVYKPLIACQENGKYIVLGGNMRIRALMELGMKDVDVSIVEAKTEAQKIKYALSDNDRVGFYQEQELAELVYPHLEEIKLEDYKIDLGEAIDLKQVVERYGPDLDDGADEIPEIDDSPAITKMGDLFMLGKHRLLCGDSTKAEDVARLMKGEKASLCFTSPPYNQGGSGIKSDYYGKQQPFYYNRADNKTAEDYKDFLLSVFKNLSLYVENTASVFWNVSYNANARDDYGRIVFARENPFRVVESIIWHKNSCFNIATKGILSRLCEFIFILCLSENYQTNQRNNECRYNFWQISSQNTQESKIHYAAFPVNLPMKAINEYGKNGCICLDPFLGVGSTLIAAEKTGRICFGCEIEPKYIDIVIKRYADYVGVVEDSIRATRESG